MPFFCEKGEGCRKSGSPKEEEKIPYLSEINY